jgi:hypothetical protein
LGNTKLCKFAIFFDKTILHKAFVQPPLVNSGSNFQSEEKVSLLEGEVAELKREVAALKGSVKDLAAVVSPVRESACWESVDEFPLQTANPMEGIISSLTKKHGGNVHKAGVVTITSKSVLFDDEKHGVQVVGDLTSDLRFWSKDEESQWICWDFHERRVRPTHYGISTRWLKSWVVESSVDGTNWTVIHQQMNNRNFANGGKSLAFAVLNQRESRFIRLTQTEKRHRLNNLVLKAVEFFGKVCE